MKILRVGTDCSGVEAPLVALQSFPDYQIDHVFSSEINAKNIAYINQHFKPRIMYGDITQRDHSTIPPIDLYVAGFPCQSFSVINRKHSMGLDDPTKGNILFHCVSTIQATQPKYFLLENVRGILWHDKHQTFPRVCKILDTLVDYQIQYKVLNTLDYGVPQSRNRIYWVGIHKSKCSQMDFKFPDPKPMRPLSEFLEPNPEIIKLSPAHSAKLERLYTELPRYKREIRYVIAMYNSRLDWMRPAINICPCITTGGPYYLNWLDRCLTTRELFNLQGFPNDFPIDGLTVFQAGNTMSVNVLRLLLEGLLSLE